MGLETATYVANLNEAWPVGEDQRATLDDHIRLIKANLKRTFVNADGPVNLSAEKFNFLNDVSRSVQYQLNMLRDGSATVANAIVANYANSASFAAYAQGIQEITASAVVAQYSAAQIAVLARTTDQTFKGGVVYRADATTGSVAARGGSTSNPGYVEFRTPDDTRRGYIGWSNGSGRLIIAQEASWGWDFFGVVAPTINSSAILHASSALPAANLSGTVPNTSISLASIQQHQANITAGNATQAVNAATANNSSLLGGAAPSENVAASTVAVRDGSGDLKARYFNASNGQDNGTADNVITTQGDNYFRKMAPSVLGSQISAQNISGRSGTAKFLAAGNGPPSVSGTINGTFWYYY